MTQVERPVIEQSFHDAAKISRDGWSLEYREDGAEFMGEIPNLFPEEFFRGGYPRVRIEISTNMGEGHPHYISRFNAECDVAEDGLISIRLLTEDTLEATSDFHTRWIDGAHDYIGTHFGIWVRSHLSGAEELLRKYNAATKAKMDFEAQQKGK